MKISSCEFISFSSCFNFISRQVSTLTLKQKVGLVALTILGSAAIYYLSCCWIQAQLINSKEDDLEQGNSLKENEKENGFPIREQSQKVQQASQAIQKKEEHLKDEPSKSQILPPYGHQTTFNPPSIEIQEPPLNPSTSRYSTPYKPKPKPPVQPKKDENNGTTLPVTPKKPVLYSPGKAKAVGNYQRNPKECSKIQKNIIFTEIRYIETLEPTTDLTSVVDLMLYVSGLDNVDLKDSKCSQVVIDTFKGCNKETSEELCHWLVKQPTFHPPLFKESLAVLIDMYQQQKPINVYSLELLLKLYIDNEWNLMRDVATGQLLLPSNDETLVSAMEILISCFPYEARIAKLVEWFMDQPEYNPQIFLKWVKIFQRKELQSGKTVVYPLLITIIEHFVKKWDECRIFELDYHLATYLQQRNLVQSK